MQNPSVFTVSVSAARPISGAPSVAIKFLDPNVQLPYIPLNRQVALGERAKFPLQGQLPAEESDLPKPLLELLSTLAEDVMGATSLPSDSTVYLSFWPNIWQTREEMNARYTALVKATLENSAHFCVQ